MQTPFLTEFRELATVEDCDNLAAALAAKTPGWKHLALEKAAVLEATAIKLNYEVGELRGKIARAVCYYYLGRISEAIDITESVHARLLSQALDIDRVYVGSLRALLMLRSGEAEQALDAIMALAPIVESVEPSAATCLYYNRLLICQAAAGLFNETLESGFKALSIAEEIDEPALIANVMSNIGASHHDAGNYEDAVLFHDEAMRLVEQYDIPDLTIVSSNLAITVLELQDYDRAWELAAPIYNVGPDAGDPDIYAYARNTMAHIMVKRGAAVSAHELLNGMEEYVQDHQLAEESVRLAAIRSELALLEDRADDAIAAIDTINRDAIPDGFLVDLKGQEARAAAAAGQWERAYRALDEYTTLLEERRQSARMASTTSRHIEQQVRGLREERDAALQREAELAKLATRDYLTGLGNRRYLGEYLRELVQRAGSRFSFVMLDLDRFKKINDTYGHGVGDIVLKAASDLLKDSIRAGDVAFRFGGEEFCLILHRATAGQAVDVMNNVASLFAEMQIEAGGETLTGLTFSAGVAEYPLDGRDESELYDRADAALYAAKHAGRNAIRTSRQLSEVS